MAAAFPHAPFASMTKTSALVEQATQLDWADDGTVTITPHNQDRYNIKVRQAIQLLQIVQDQDIFDSELRLLLNKCGAWLNAQDGVKSACMTIRDGGLLFVVVRDSAEYCEEFEDSLTDLDIAIANDCDLSRIRADVIALPDACDKALETFVDPTFVIQYTPPSRRD